MLPFRRERVGVLLVLVVPELFVERLQRSGIVVIRPNGERRITRRAGEDRHCRGGADPDCAGVNVRLNVGQWSVLHRSQSRFLVVHQAVVVFVGRQRPVVGLLDDVPRPADKRGVRGMTEVVPNRANVEWRSIAVDVAVRIIFPPIYIGGGLGEFVGHLSVCALPLVRKLECVPNIVVSAVTVQAEGIDERVATEEPSESGPSPGSRRTETGYHARSRVRIVDEEIVERHLGPFKRKVHTRIRRGDLKRGKTNVAVMLAGLAVIRFCIGRKPLIDGTKGISFSVSAGDHNGNVASPHRFRFVDHDLELIWPVGEHMRGRIRHSDGCGGAYISGVAACRFGDLVCLEVVEPSG